MRALAHVDMGDVDRHHIVGADLHPAGEKMLAIPLHLTFRRPLVAACPGAIAQHQPAGSKRSGAEEKRPASHDRFPHAFAASAWIALRMRG
jgi:hypothetical protein